MLGRISRRMLGRIFGPRIFGPRIFGTMPSPRLVRRSQRSVAGKAEAERGAVTGAALDRDRAAVLFENTPADGQSESGTAGPGAESRLEDARQVLPGDARPGIARTSMSTPPPSRSSRRSHSMPRIESHPPPGIKRNAFSARLSSTRSEEHTS